MNRTALAALIMGTALLTSPAQTAAQTGLWSFEARVGSALPTGDIAEPPGLNQTAGLSFSADVMYSVNPRLSVYGGLARQSFNCSGCSTELSTMGFDGGLKMILGSDRQQATPWVRAGLMLHRASVDDVDNDWGVGVDTAAGIDWAITPHLAIVPAVRLNSYDSGPLSMTYVTIDLGLHVHPGR